MKYIDNLRQASILSIEVRRKLIHLSSLWIVLCIYYLGSSASSFFALLFVLLLGFEWLRCKHLLPTLLHSALQPILRTKELGSFRITGASWMLLAAFLCSLLFDASIAFAAMIVLVISDSCAALVGIRWGSVSLGSKSLQGSISFFISASFCLIITNYLYSLDSLSYTATLVVAMVATLVELLTDKLYLDDNLTIPLSVALSIYLIDSLGLFAW